MLEEFLNVLTTHSGTIVMMFTLKNLNIMLSFLSNVILATTFVGVLILILEEKLKKMPALRVAYSVVDDASSNSFQHPISKKWLPCRCAAFRGNPFKALALRIKLAYYVFVGRYDALDWQDNDK